MELGTDFPASEMFKKLWIKFFLLLVAVSVIALSAALLLRELMVTDFREYLEGEMEDQAYWITAALESTYEKHSGWSEQGTIEDTVWALMLGFDIKLYDTDGSLVMETEKAINTLSPLVKKRVMTISELRLRERSGRFLPYALFLGGEEIGHLELKFLRPKKEMVFIKRSNKLLLISILALGGVAIILSIVFSRKLTNPIKGLIDAVTAIGEGKLKSRVEMSGRDEISRLSEAFNRMAHTLELQESLRKKLTSNIAHELRTPVSAVRGELEGMMDGFIPMDNEHIQSLHSEIGRLKSILEGIEELSQAEASSLTLRKQLLKLGPFLKNIVERFKKLLQDKSVAVELLCDDKLIVNADPDRLSQIIINLLSNSMKATKKGGSVWIKAFKKESEVFIKVTDDGCGINKDDLPFVFERFYKASDGGLGLGLTIVRELVEAHGGKITVQSEQGKKTAFIVTLPV
jgi:two-component system sensor histidine kinase BaeS